MTPQDFADYVKETAVRKGLQEDKAHQAGFLL